jgi:addiction module HigA family antidote
LREKTEPTGHRPDPREQQPGAILRQHVLPALRLSVSQAARDLGIARQTLHRILAGNAAITPEMAVRLEKLCGISSNFWLELQQQHDLQRVEEEFAVPLSRIPQYSLPSAVIKQIGAGHDRT